MNITYIYDVYVQIVYALFANYIYTFRRNIKAYSLIIETVNIKSLKLTFLSLNACEHHSSLIMKP